MGGRYRSGSSIIPGKSYRMRHGHEHERPLLCLVGPIVVGILSALVAVAPYLLAVLLILGVIAFFCK